MRQDQGVIEAYLGTRPRRKRRYASAAEAGGEEPCAHGRGRAGRQDIVTAYGSIQALHGVSLTVGKGEVVAVLGANGAGKTTLLNTVCGILRQQRHLSLTWGRTSPRCRRRRS